MSELAVAEKWLVTRMLARTQLVALVGERVYVGTAPQDAAYPYVLAQLMSAEDVRVQSSIRLATRPFYQVEAWATGESYPHAVAREIDLALAASGVQDGFSINVWRVAPVQLAQIESGKEYRRSGGQYEIWVRPI